MFGCDFQSQFGKLSAQVGHHHSQQLPLLADWTNLYRSGHNGSGGCPGVAEALRPVAKNIITHWRSQAKLKLGVSRSTTITNWHF